MRRIGIALVGLGPASQPHLKSLADLAERVDVRWAVSRSEARLAAFAATSPYPTTTDIGAALADPAVEAVILLTPPAVHRDLAERAFVAGKHVLVEKPLALDSAQGERLVAAGRRSGRRLGVVLQHRFRAASLRLGAILRDGALGPVEAASCQVHWWRPQSYYDEPGRGTLARDGGGVLLTQAIHALDLFRSLLDIGEVVSAVVATTGLHRMETEDYAAALLRLANSAPATLSATTASYPGSPERMEVIGREGTATLVGGALEVRYLDGREERVAAEGGSGSGAGIMDFPHDAHRAVLADFLDAIEEDRDPLVTGEEALATQRLIDAILKAGARDRSGS